MSKRYFFAAVLALLVCINMGAHVASVFFKQQTLFSQPRIGADSVDSHVFANEVPPPGNFAVVLWQMGSNAAKARVNWDVGQYTGFRPTGDNVAWYQRGSNKNTNSTAVQLKDRTVGIWLNTANIACSSEVIPIVAQYDWPSNTLIYPWQDRENVLSIAFEMQIPFAERRGEGQAYVTAPFLFHDTSLNKAFWLNLQIFDFREPLPEQVIHDACVECTNQPIVVSSFTKNTHFGRIASGSALFSAVPWHGFRYFEYRISAAEFTRIIAALRENTGQVWSFEFGHYRLTHVNINPEIYAPCQQGDGKIGLSVRSITVALEKELRFFP
jgi:hypothetical protein